ncbi:hypothetical protein METBIDRAFT_20925, partial [Metschnikowia bicuspidata var. bicuspidata NRRL YB-4993]
ATDLPAIEISGNKFYYSNNGSQFLMRGVAYQQDTDSTSTTSFVDPLTDYDSCLRDIPYLQELQTNVIRVYALNVSQDHTDCMEALAAANIYVIADLSEPDLSIDRDDPTWTLELLDRYTSVVDAFHNYTNILGFFAGNEVTNNASNTDASAYVKAAVRDTKAYILEMGYKSIPVGYSSNDDSDIRLDLAEYFACGDESDRADFFGINMYEWCGDSTYETSGYETITEEYKNLGVPIFFSEYGCNEVSPRNFTEVQAIYSDEMTDVWSGGIVYMYYEETNNYGLVTIDNSEVSTLDDFNNLKSQIALIDPSYTTIGSVTTSATVTTCPTVGGYWSATTVLPPTPDSEVCDCMVASLSCVGDSTLDSDGIAELFSYVCGEVDCSGVTGNGTTGIYGSYSACKAKAQLDFVLNLYYSANGESSTACDFSGSASLQTASTASSCTAILSSAGEYGTGTVSGTVRTTTDSASTTTVSGSDSGSTSDSSSSSTSSSSTSGSASAHIAFSPL